MDHITHLFIFSFDEMIKITTFIFIILLISPIVGGISGFRNEQLHENRELVKIPEYSANNYFDPSFYSNIERYYNDHFIYRGVLVKAKSLIDYYVFNTSITSNVYIGAKEWLYLREELPDYYKDGCRARNDMRELARQIYRMEKFLEQKGKRFIFIVAPNKSTIYPEYVGLSHSYSAGCRSKYEYLLDAFKEYPVKGFIRLDDTLLQAKKDKQIYYKDDTHWNVNGAEVASIKILKYLRPISWDKDLPEVEVIKEYRAGDLANMMSINLRTKESVIKHINFPFKIDENVLQPEDQIYPKQFKSESISGELIPRTIILRDSFMNLPLKIIKGSFEQLDTYWWEFHLSDPRVVEDIRASKVIVIECVERYLEPLRANLPIISSALEDKKPSVHP